MRPILILLLLIAAILLAGSLLAYPLQLLLSLLFESRFHKVVHYTSLLMALALGITYLQASRQTGPVLGLRPAASRPWTLLLGGFLGGALILLLVEGCLALLQMRQPDPDLGRGAGALVQAVIKALLSGCLVGLLEETLYRGAVYTGLARFSGVRSALLASSGLYAGVHFIDIPELPGAAHLNWLSGPVLLSRSFTGCADPGNIDAFISLFLLGLLLALVRLHHGNILPCIGLHAGIVTVNKIISYATDHKPGGSWEFLVNRYDHQNGILASAVLAVAALLYYRYIVARNADRQTGT